MNNSSLEKLHLTVVNQTPDGDDNDFPAMKRSEQSRYIVTNYMRVETFINERRIKKTLKLEKLSQTFLVLTFRLFLEGN